MCCFVRVQTHHHGKTEIIVLVRIEICGEAFQVMTRDLSGSLKAIEVSLILFDNLVVFLLVAIYAVEALP